MFRFASGVKGMCMNLEAGQVGVVLFGSDRLVKEGESVSADELRAWLTERVAKWWVPERWTFIDEVPKTSVGKFDKKVLRKNYTDGELTIEQLG